MTKIADGLYHRELGLPPGFHRFLGEFALNYTRHAQTAFIADRYYFTGLAPLKRLAVVAKDIVEAEFVGGECVKVVVRVPLTDRLDAVLALINPVSTTGHETVVVKTFWMNETTDTHRTLDASKYIRWNA